MTATAFAASLIILTASAPNAGANGTLCYTCDGVDSINDCNVLQRCQPSEICYLYTNGTNNGNSSPKIYGGCIPKSMCCSTSENSTNQLMCSECCEGDFCNNKLCGQKVNGVECFNCSNTLPSKDCLQVAICQPTDICGVFYYADDTVTYRCENELKCNMLNSPQKRISKEEYFQLGGRCCKSPYCNQNLTLLVRQANTATVVCPVTTQASPKTSAAPGVKTTMTPQKSSVSVLTTVPSTASKPPTTSTISTTAKATFASLQTTTTGPASAKCAECNGPLCVAIPGNVKQCPPTTPFCMNVLNNSQNGMRSVTKSCASAVDCEAKWWLQSSDRTECVDFKENQHYNYQFTCTYCCTKDLCNRDLYPKITTLYEGSA